MTLRMLAIHGSARSRGNSRTLLDTAVSGAMDVRDDLTVERVRAYEARVDPCIACGRCEEDVVGCAREGDGWTALESSLRSADVLLLATPVYFMGLPAPVKAIVDRLQGLWWHRERGGQVATNKGPYRRCGLILVASGDGSVFRPSERMAKAAFNTLGFTLEAKMLAGGLENPGDAERNTGLLAEARELGTRLVA